MLKSLFLLVQLFAATYGTDPLKDDLYTVLNEEGTSLEDGIEMMFEPLIDEPLSKDRPPLDFSDFLEDGAKVNRESLDSGHRSRQKRSESEYVYPPREGSPTRTHSCNHVRGVPDELRSPSGMRPDGLKEYYQKYTEAYNIPVLASSKVPDDTLRRACYVLRFVLADHSAVRTGFYKRHGRVAVKADSDLMTDIPEYDHRKYRYVAENNGLGGTITVPVSTGEIYRYSWQHDHFVL